MILLFGLRDLIRAEGSGFQSFTGLGQHVFRVFGCSGEGTGTVLMSVAFYVSARRPASS